MILSSFITLGQIFKRVARQTVNLINVEMTKSQTKHFKTFFLFILAKIGEYITTKSFIVLAKSKLFLVDWMNWVQIDLK
jgi:hypothetical protein